METLLNNAKRKKRKTRKCLDEIRQRSRNTSVKNNTSQERQLLPKIRSILTCDDEKKYKNNCITSKRLTLTMFANAVRSETITRPLLCNGTQDQSLVLKTRSPITSPLNILIESKSSEVPAQNCNEDLLTGQSDNGNSENRDGSLSDRIVWFSTASQALGQNYNDSNNEGTLSTVTSTSQSSEDYGYQLYEELLEDIPLFAKKHLSNFMKYNVIERTKTCLQSLYYERIHQNYNSKIQADNLLKIKPTSAFTTQKESIVQNPMDYIKIGCRQDFHLASEDSVLSDTSVSPVGSSPLGHNQIPSIVSYTPDYDFYPHKLNE